MNKRTLESALVLAATLIWACKKETTVAPVPARENTVQMRRLITVARPIIVDVLGQGFASQSELQQFVTKKYEPVNTRLPFDQFSHPLVFDPHALSTALPLTPVADVKKCYFILGADFKKDLTAAQTLSPNARFTILVVNVPKDPTTGIVPGIGACASSNNLIVTSQLVDADALAHEFGHALGGLKDETATGGKYIKNQTTPHKEPNCSDDDVNPGWVMTDTRGATIAPFPGCEGFISGLFHPSDDCRMASPDSDFCCVCTTHMLRHLNDQLGTNVALTLPCQVLGPTPAGAVAVPTKGRFITAEFGLSGAGPIVGDEITILYRSPLVAGDQFATIVAGNQIITTASLPDPPDTARAYPPGHGIDTKVAAPLPAKITFFVPGTLPPGSLERRVFELPGFGGKARLDDMKAPLMHMLTFGTPP